MPVFSNSSYWDSDAEGHMVDYPSTLEDCGGVGSSFNLCGANPNLHPSSQTPVGMGPIGGLGPMTGGLMHGLMNTTLSLMSGGGNSGLGPSLGGHPAREGNTGDGHLGSSASMSDLQGDEGGGLIIISAADVNGVLTEGGEGDDNPPDDDFASSLDNGGYSPINDSFSLEQFFPNVNNTEDDPLMRSNYLSPSNNNNNSSYLNNNNNSDYNDRNSMLSNNSNNNTSSSHNNSTNSSSRIDGNTTTTTSLNNRTVRRDGSSLSSLSTRCPTSSFHIKEEPDLFLDDEPLSSGLLTPGPMDAPTFTQLAPAQPYPPMGSQHDQSFASLLKESTESVRVTSSVGGLCPSLGDDSFLSRGVKREGSNSGNNNNNKSVAADNPLLAELLASPATDMPALINNINIKSEVKKETLDTSRESYKGT